MFLLSARGSMAKPSMKRSSAPETAPRILLSGLRAHAIYYSA